MRTLRIPKLLQHEFSTVLAVLNVPNKESDTKNLDAIILAWVKYKKQVRKIFSFLVYENEMVTYRNWRKVEAAISGNAALTWRAMFRACETLGRKSVLKSAKKQNKVLYDSINKINSRRNKLLHGHVTNLGLDGPALLNQVQDIVSWMELVAQIAESEVGYNGIDRNTFLLAKSRKKLIATRRFDTIEELLEWTETFGVLNAAAV